MFLFVLQATDFVGGSLGMSIFCISIGTSVALRVISYCL